MAGDAAPHGEVLDTDESLAENETDTASNTPRSNVRAALIVSLATVVALAGLTGWLGYRTWEAHRAQEQREQFLQVARQGALNLTTIDWQHADADVQRVLDSATGTFYDDYQQRSEPFKQVVEVAKSTSVGTIAEAGWRARPITRRRCWSR